ncbi:hypothetical protein Droror1_Dr00027186 [Drosera rotundifolia]
MVQCGSKPKMKQAWVVKEKKEVTESMQEVVKPTPVGEKFSVAIVPKQVPLSLNANPEYEGWKSPHIIAKRSQAAPSPLDLSLGRFSALNVLSEVIVQGAMDYARAVT